MSTTTIETPSLTLILESPEDVRGRIEAMSPSEKAELSADWLALLESATSADPWIHGFALMQRTDDAVVGSCGFKGPPTPDGVVEIAYGVAPEYRGKGYATEAAQALVSYAFSNRKVRVVRAHTLAQANASTRVLAKCGFRRIGEVVDSDDGLVWRWEKHHGAA
ncbi:MAG: GNAT family N-acetyltransferase [Gammaproteobacteria bacterium]